MSARARRIRRHRRNHGKPIGKTGAILIRYRLVAWVFSNGRLRMRRIDYHWDEHQIRVFSKSKRQYVFLAKHQEASPA